VVVETVKRFRIGLKEVHNDATTVRLTGQYPAAKGRSIRGRRAPWITRSKSSKDHRPDLKQLLFILTTSADGGIPVQFRAADGNASDARSHIETWEVLRRITGRSDFLSCPARGTRTRSFASGSRRMSPPGKWPGTGRTRVGRMVRETLGASFTTRYPLGKVGR
jgi:hypothetical protein